MANAGTGTFAGLLVAVVVGVGACSGESSPPDELVDGSRARPPAVLLDAPTPQLLTRVSVVRPRRARDGTRAARCLATAREHSPSGPIVVRVGVSGASATFRTASDSALVACDGAGTARAGWCGRAYGRLESGRLHDPRLDLTCANASGAPLGFAWFEPGRRTAYVAVQQRGYTEVYRVAGGTPVRISTTTRVSATRSSAEFEVSEHDRRGALLRASTFTTRVAG